MKQSLIFVLIAVLSAGLVFVGCSSDSGGGGGTAAPGIDGIVIDATVDSEAGLRDAFVKDSIEVVALVLSGGNQELSTLTVIPYGKTLVLLNTDSVRHSLTPSESGLNIRGSVIVSENTELSVNKDRPVYLWSDGNVQVQARGLFTTDARSSVSNYTDAGVGQESVLTKNVSYKGGSILQITGEGDALTIDIIKGLLGTLTQGTVLAANAPTGASSLILTAKLENIKPSDVLQLADSINASRTISIKPAAAETETTLTIPAGADVETEVDLSKITSLTITNGTLAAPNELFTALVELNVTKGEFEAPKAAPKEEVALRVTDGAVAAPIIAKTGSELIGKSEVKGVEGDFSAAPGVIINGGVVPEGASKIRMLTAKDATAVALTVAAGEFVQIVGATPYVASTIDIPETATVSVKGSLKVTSSTTLAAGGFKGTIIVENEGTLHDATTGGNTFWPDPAAQAVQGNTGKIIYKVGSKGALGDSPTTKIGSGASDPLQLISGTITLTHNSYTLEGEASVTESFELAEDNLNVASGILTIAAEKNLTANKNVAVAIASTLKVAGTFTLKGTLTNTGTIEVVDGGSFVMNEAADKPGTNNGTIAVRSGGFIHGAHGKDLEGTGYVVVDAGGKGKTGEVCLIGGDGSPLFTLTRGTFSINKTQNILDGEGTLNGAYKVGKDSQVLTITQGSTLTIGTAGQLVLTTDGAVISGYTGTVGAAKIVVTKSTGKVTFLPNGASSNFYDGSGTKTTTEISSTESDATYVWTSTISGWKKQ